MQVQAARPASHRQRGTAHTQKPRAWQTPLSIVHTVAAIRLCRQQAGCCWTPPCSQGARWQPAELPPRRQPRGQRRRGQEQQNGGTDGEDEIQLQQQHLLTRCSPRSEAPCCGRPEPAKAVAATPPRAAAAAPVTMMGYSEERPVPVHSEFSTAHGHHHHGKTSIATWRVLPRPGPPASA